MVFQWLTNRKENCVVRETFFFIAVITIVNLIKSSKSIKKIPNWLYAKPQQPNRINNVLYIIIIIIQQLIYYFITLLQLALFTLNTNQLLLKNCYARSVFFFLLLLLWIDLLHFNQVNHFCYETSPQYGWAYLYSIVLSQKYFFTFLHFEQ